MNRFTQPIRALALGLIAIATIGLAAPALADSKVTRADRLAEKLELSADQQEQIEALHAAHRGQMKSESRSEDGERSREARREARAALHEEIRSVLTEAQAEKFDAMHQRKGHGDRHGRHHKMAMSALDLSDEQRSAMRKLMDEHRGDREAIRAGLGEILTEEQLTQLEATRGSRGGDGERHKRQRRHNH
ncbi:MAG: hypothetical protein ACNA7E_08570 [Wenzhouxiangellaceae bacterium]